jgi:hypothetical protein
MKQELVAYLIRDKERVSEMPTEEILFALDQLRQASTIQEQSISSDKAAVSQFLQAVKLAMRAAKDGSQVQSCEASRFTYDDSVAELSKHVQARKRSGRIRACCLNW